MEAPDLENKYDTHTTMHKSPKLRSKNLSSSGFVNTNSTNIVNSGKGSLTTQNFFPSVSGANIMAGIDIKLPILTCFQYLMEMPCPKFFHVPNFSLGHNGLITFSIFMRDFQIDAKGQIIYKEENY